MSDAFLAVTNIRKEYPGTVALNTISCSFEQGKIHALLGKNGSGKSTFANIIAGITEATSGSLYLQGKEVYFKTPQEAQKQGISVVHQELSLVSSLTVAENIFLGDFKVKKFWGTIDWKATELAASSILDKIGIHIPPRAVVSSLSIGQKQQVEIAKALVHNPSLLILDEPTSALALQEVDKLFSIMKNLKTHGVTMIYISHRLQELSQIADTVNVLRDGDFIGSLSIKQATHKEVLKMMFGKVTALTKERSSVHDTNHIENNSTNKKIVLKVKGIVRDPILKGVSFSLYDSEVLGIAGLLGSGRTEIMRSIYGLDPFHSGTITVFGEERNNISPAYMKQLGLSFVSEDRKEEGLVQLLSSHRNLIHAAMEDKISYKKYFITKKREQPFVSNQITTLSIKLSSSEYPVSTLSGGNQQKVVVGNWLNAEPRIMLFDEPSRGIDVEAKQQIFSIIWEQKKKGVSTIMVSSELEELHEVCDRILVLRDGVISEEVYPGDITINQLYEKCMTN